MKKERLSVTGTLLLAFPALIIYFFSTSPPFHYSGEKEAGLIVSFKMVTARVHDCTDEEKRAFVRNSQDRRPHMRRRMDQACGSRERIPLGLKIWIDRKIVTDKKIIPSGFSQDRACFVMEKFILPTGGHTLKVGIKESKATDSEFDHVLERDFDLPGRRVMVVDFDSDHHKFIIR